MRLLHAKTLQLKDFPADNKRPNYAILSHVWGEEEITLQELDNQETRLKEGWVKIQYCCNQALKDGLEWAWIDTCCIDKKSSAELSEAINSMFRWYKEAVVCYAYLFDVPGLVDPAIDSSELQNSKWFTRGWTLQELLAPRVLQFFSNTWKSLGTKEQLYNALASITEIESQTLQGENLNMVSVATRMSWAAKRETTRTEDMAYCLLGIFNINMPLLYGEGKQAFIRLQEIIIKTKSDQSIFAWATSSIIEVEQFMVDEMTAPASDSAGSYTNKSITDKRFTGLLADSPADFEHSQHIDALAHWRLKKDGFEPKPPVMYDQRIAIDLPVVQIVYDSPGAERRTSSRYPVAQKKFEIAVLGCRIRKGFEVDEHHLLGVPIDSVGYDRSEVRYRKLVTISKSKYTLEPSDELRTKLRSLNLAGLSTVLSDIERMENGQANYASHPNFPGADSGYPLVDVHCAPSTKFDRRNGVLYCDTTGDTTADGVEAVFVFRCATSGSFAIAMFSKPRWFTFMASERVMAERIYVYAKVLPRDVSFDSFFASIPPASPRLSSSRPIPILHHQSSSSKSEPPTSSATSISSTASSPNARSGNSCSYASRSNICQAVFESIKLPNSGWQSLKEINSFYPAKHCEESPRKMRMRLGDGREALVTTRWFRWGNRKGWQEELTVEVVGMGMGGSASASEAINIVGGGVGRGPGAREGVEPARGVSSSRGTR